MSSTVGIINDNQASTSILSSTSDINECVVEQMTHEALW